MKLSVIRKAPIQCETEALIVGHHENSQYFEGAAKALDEVSGGLLSYLLETGDFRGRKNETVLLYSRDLLPAKRVLLVGLGKRDDLTEEKLRVAMAGASKRIRELKVKEFALSLDFGDCKVPAERAAQAAAEGIMLGLHRFSAYKKEDPDSIEILSATIIDQRAAHVKIMKSAVREAETICNAAILARNLVATPPSEMTPALLAREARRMCRNTSIPIKVLEPPAMKRMGMHALLAVGRGSAHPPRLAIMEYQGAGRGKRPVVLVGKGITFDSGGVNLKPASGMEQMKDDMAGAATVIAVLKAAAELELPVNLVGIVPAAENMPDGQAYKPGDILKSYSGQTIEVVSTDAEGRLILADALSYAKRFKPAALIDIATLTGACVIALGDYLTGMLGNDDRIKEGIRAAAERTGEVVWELPLWEEYEDLIKSDIADMKNTGGRAAGTITAALFLKKFVEDGIPWVHLDIAGTSFSPKDKGYLQKGPTGTGVRLLVDFLKNWTYRTDGPNS